MIKQRIFFLLFCLLATTWLVAQPGHQRSQQLEMSEEVKTALQLTPEQRTQLDELQTNTDAQLATIREQSTADRASKKAELRQVMETHKTGVESILSEEQFAQLKTLRQVEGNRRHQLAKADRKALRDEVKAYQTANIEPVMLAQRQKLEAQLSTEDIATLATIRTKLANARAEARANREKEQAEGQAQGERQAQGKQHARGNRRGGGKSLAQQFPEEQATLEAMLVRYEQPISTLFEEVAPQKEQWDADLKEIKVRHQSERAGEGAPSRPESAPNPERVAKREMAAKIQFLLKDPAGK